MQNKNKERIKLLFEGSVLRNGVENNSARSGIFFVAYNLLHQLSKAEDIEVYLFLPFMTKLDVLELKNMKIIPENCNIVLKHFFIFDFFKLILKKCDKKNDNILKKIIRFIIFRAERLFYFIQISLFSIDILTKSYDVYFSPINNIPKRIKNIKKIKKYMIIHDLIPLKLKKFYEQQGIYRMKPMEKILNSLDNTVNYFAVSNSTKKDLVECNNKIKQDNICVVYPAPDNFLVPKTAENINYIKQKYNIQDKKYVLSLCSIEPRKNIVFAIKNFTEFINKYGIEDLIFVQAGGIWHEYANEFNNFYNTVPNNKIIRIGYVEDSDKPLLYAGALMFFGAYLYEGFGLPILEAMQQSCPVITSNTSSLPEVAGNAGIIINPKNDEELQEAYKTLYYNDDIRTQCIENGLKRTKEFSWEKTSSNIIYKIKQDLNYENII